MRRKRMKTMRAAISNTLHDLSMLTRRQLHAGSSSGRRPCPGRCCRSLASARHRNTPDVAECGPAPYDCAVAQVQRQEFAAAIATLERLVAQAPRDLKALNLLGIALTGAGKPEDAIPRFRAALAIDPRFPRR